MAGESIIETRKYYKRNKVLGVIRTRENCSRYDIKKLTSYSMATVLGIITELVGSGLIYEEESTENKVGRKPTWLRINERYGCFIGLEFHSKQANCAMLDFKGNKLFEDSRPLREDDPQALILEKFFDLIDAAIAFDRSAGHLLGIGVGVAGYFDSEAGLSYQYPPLKNWSNVPIRQLIMERYGCECYVENNVTALAIGYKHLYMPHRTDDFLFASLRSGVRIVPYVQNSFLLSRKGYAGQLGHIAVAGSDRLCLCGRRGCLNTEVSIPGLRSKLIEAVLADHMQPLLRMAGGDIANVTFGLFVEAALQGDAECLALLEETAGFLGRSLGTMLDILAPRTLVVYGELCRMGEKFLKPLEQTLRGHAMPSNTRKLEVLLCQPDESMGGLGAASLVMQRQFEYLDETI